MLLSVVDPNTIVLLALPGIIFGGIFILAAGRAQHDGELHDAKSALAKPQLPPRYPSGIPYFGTIAALLWDFQSFLQRATTSNTGEPTSSRLAIAPFCDIHLFQDRDTVKEVWRKSAVMAAGKVHVYACRYMFGMSEKTLCRYEADNSGPFPKPYPGSSVSPENRIHRLLNDGISKALSGSGFDPKLQRFRKSLVSQMQQLQQTTVGEGVGGRDGIEIRDLHKFIHHTVGLAIIEAIFGPNLVRLNPTFMDDLFEFEHWIPLLGKGLPSFVIPRAYAVRRRLHGHFKVWYAYAREHFVESCIGEDGDADPFWGSEWMRERQKSLEMLQDEDSLAAGDLGVAWASLANIVGATTLILMHIAKTPGLADRVREQVTSEFGQQPLGEIDLKALANNPLLSSVYAETLRLHVKTFTVVSAPLENVSLGNFWLPKGQLGLVTTQLAHMDGTFWNTKDDMHPLDSFWPERFLTDPADPSSGPSKLPRIKQGRSQSRQNGDNIDVTAPYFSMKGLEGSWIPFGGGHLVCPGRFLAKNVMIFTSALFTRHFDLEYLNRDLDLGSKGYGFGVCVTKHPIHIRMKRR